MYNTYIQEFQRRRMGIGFFIDNYLSNFRVWHAGVSIELNVANRVSLDTLSALIA